MNASRSSPQPHRHHSRKIHYVDHLLQKRLLIALVVLEVTLLCIAGAILYTSLNAIVDENLYRIHFADQPSMFSVLLKESLLILGGLVAANLVALFVADRIWSHYVNGIMQTLRDLLSRTRDLDLRPDVEAPYRHKVLELALAWRQVERTRNLALRDLSDRAEALAGQQPIAEDELRRCLLSIIEQLHGSGAARPPTGITNEDSAR